MIARLVSLIGGPKLIGIGVAAVAFIGLAGWGYVQQTRVEARDATIDAQREQLNQVTAANASLVASIEELKRNHQRETAALKQQADSAARAAAQADRVRQYVRDSKQKSDPLADPVLDGAVKRLRRPRAPDGDLGPGGAPAPAIGAPILP